MPFGPPSYAYALVAGNLVPWLQATRQPGARGHHTGDP